MKFRDGNDYKDNGEYLSHLSAKIGHCKELATAHGALVCKREKGWTPVEECCPRLNPKICQGVCIFYRGD